MDASSERSIPPAALTEERKRIVIYFSTLWPNAVLRHSVGGGDWKNAAFEHVRRL